MNNILKKIEKLPLIAIFFVLWFAVAKILSPLFSMIFYKSGWQVLLPSLGGFILSASIITIAVMQIIKKNNIAVPIAAGVWLICEIFTYFGSVVTFFSNAFSGYSSAGWIITYLIDGLVQILTILALASLVVVGLYGAGIIKKLGKLNLLVYAPAAFAALALIITVISCIIGILFNMDNYYFVEGIFKVLIISIPAAFWYALTIASAGLWAGVSGREREEISAEVVEEVTEEVVETPVE